MSDRVKAVLAQIQELNDDEQSELTAAIRESLWNRWQRTTDELSATAKSRGIDEKSIAEAVMQHRYQDRGDDK